MYEIVDIDIHRIYIGLLKAQLLKNPTYKFKSANTNCSKLCVLYKYTFQILRSLSTFCDFANVLAFREEILLYQYYGELS